jgi:hypothetical protein
MEPEYMQPVKTTSLVAAGKQTHKMKIGKSGTFVYFVYMKMIYVIKCYSMLE